jgi:hypothetical protein
MRIYSSLQKGSLFQFLVCRSNHCNFRKEDTMYKTANTLPEKIRLKSVATLVAGLVALTALSMTPLTASAGTTHGAGVTSGEIQHVVVKYLTEHPELRQAVPTPYGTYADPHGICVGDSEHQC